MAFDRIANVTHDSAVIAFETNRPVIAKVVANGRTFLDKTETTRHEIELTGIPSAQHIRYTVQAGGHAETML